MQTYSIEVTGISEELFYRLSKIQKDNKIDINTLIEESSLLDSVKNQTASSEMTFAEILAPLQQDFEATGMTDEELGDFIDAEIKAHRAERRDSQNPQND